MALRKTPSKPTVNSVEREPPSPMQKGGRVWKRWQVMVVSPTASVAGLDDAQEMLFDNASPDFSMAMVNVPQAPATLGSRSAHHHATQGLLELVRASSSGFDAILVDSIFDVGVDVAREGVQMTVCGCFYPAVSQALLLTNGSSYSIVHVVVDSGKPSHSSGSSSSSAAVPPSPAKGASTPSLAAAANAGSAAAPAADTAVEQCLLRDLARRWQVAEQLRSIRIVTVAADAAQSKVVATVSEACRACAADGAHAVVLSGTHCAALLPPSDVPVVDCTLAGLSAVEALVRAKLQQSRRVFPLVQAKE